MNISLKVEVKSVCTCISSDGAFEYFILKDGTACILNFLMKKAVGHVVVPEKIDGIKVTVIGNGVFMDCKRITRVSLPEGITTIGFFAFFRCKRLVKVDIPDSVSRIHREAFFACEKLQSVTFPNNVNVTDEAVMPYNL